MVTDSESSSTGDCVRARVRQNVVSAAIAAALLLYFGFDLLVESGDSRFAIGGRIFVYSLRMGGIVMTLAALFSLTGRISALMFDAVGSIIIGLFMLIGTVLMMSDGGGGFLYLIFATMFIVVGVRNGREAAALRQASHVPNECTLQHEGRFDEPV